MPESEVTAVKSKYLALSAMFAALTALCAWLSLPLGSVTFTLQSVSVALCLLLLGGKWGTVSILVYLLLGAAGLPVFSGFRGGIVMLLGPTGGFLVGFLAMALVYWVATALFGEKCHLWALMIGQLLCYFLGTLWVMDTYVKQGGSASFGAVMLLTVAPYLLPDAAKLTLAWLLAKRLHRRLHI